jgi:hypothetical protein
MALYSDKKKLIHISGYSEKHMTFPDLSILARE